MRIAPGAALLMVSCTADVLSPLAWTPEEPPPTYRQWYAEAEACSGKTGDFEAVSWYYRPGEGWVVGGRAMSGQWLAPHTIIVAEAYKHDAQLVRHEALHDIEQTPFHPSPPFGFCDA
jgi:hypothetical protein